MPLHSPDTALPEKLHAILVAAPCKGKLLLDLEEPGEFCAVLEPQGVTVAADRLFIDPRGGAGGAWECAGDGIKGTALARGILRH